MTARRNSCSSSVIIGGICRHGRARRAAPERRSRARRVHELPGLPAESTRSSPAPTTTLTPVVSGAAAIDRQPRSSRARCLVSLRHSRPSGTRRAKGSASPFRTTRWFTPRGRRRRMASAPQPRASGPFQNARAGHEGRHRREVLLQCIWGRARRTPPDIVDFHPGECLPLHLGRWLSLSLGGRLRPDERPVDRHVASSLRRRRSARPPPADEVNATDLFPPGHSSVTVTVTDPSGRHRHRHDRRRDRGEHAGGAERRSAAGQRHEPAEWRGVVVTIAGDVSAPGNTFLAVRNDVEPAAGRRPSTREPALLLRRVDDGRVLRAAHRVRQHLRPRLRRARTSRSTGTAAARGVRFPRRWWSRLQGSGNCARRCCSAPRRRRWPS